MLSIKKKLIVLGFGVCAVRSHIDDIREADCCQVRHRRSHSDIDKGMVLERWVSNTSTMT
jgi:hypothetical protein